MTHYNDSDFSSFAEGDESRGIDPRLSSLPSVELGDDYVPPAHTYVPNVPAAELPAIEKPVTESAHAAAAPVAASEPASAPRKVPAHAKHAAIPETLTTDAPGGTAVYQPAASAVNQARSEVRANAQPIANNDNGYAPVKPIGAPTAYDANGDNYAGRRSSGGAGNVAKNVAIALLAFILVLLVAIGGYWFWFSSQLDGALDHAEVTPEIKEALEPPTPEDGPFYVLVLGSDSREGSDTSWTEAERGDNERSDVMILTRVDLKNRVVTMLSIPRDTPYQLPDGTLVKINEMYNIGGAAASIEAVSKLTGVPITHYAEIHFSEFQQIVDSIGGVTVDVPTELTVWDALTDEEITLYPGTQTINGQQAQALARARHEYENGQDAGRQNTVRMLATAIMSKVLNLPAAEIPQTVINLAQYIGTDLRSADLVAIAAGLVGGQGGMTVYSGTGPTDGDINPEYEIWLCYQNPEGWAAVMDVVNSGGDPAGMTFESTAIPW